MGGKAEEIILTDVKNFSGKLTFYCFGTYRSQIKTNGYETKIRQFSGSHVCCGE